MPEVSLNGRPEGWDLPVAQALADLQSADGAPSSSDAPQAAR